MLTVAAMGVDGLVIRHHASGAAHQVAQWVDAVVINAGDGTHEHPTQALLDAYTMRAARSATSTAAHVAIVGDLTHCRVFRSNVICSAHARRPRHRRRAADADAERHRGLVGGRRLRDVVRPRRRCCRDGATR